MISDRNLIIAFVSVLVLATSVLFAVPPDSDFSYQGVLAEGGGPADGLYDLQFRLYDAAAGGAELGLVILDDHRVTDGRVTAELDFGDPFDGRALWLQVEVRPGASGGAHTVLTPRQPLTAAPHAIAVASSGRAASAGSASTAGDADTLGGQHGAFYRAWSNLTGTPGGFDDGDDDVLGDLGCHTGDVATWDGSAWNCDTDDGLVYTRTTVVRAVADPLANGTALMAAVDSVPTPTSQEEAWRVRLEPGVYDLGDQSLGTKPWMLLEGSGQGTTVVTSSACSESAFPAPTIWTDDDSEVRELTAVSSCASPTERASAITIGGDRGRLTRVTAKTVGAADYALGVWVQGVSAVLERVNVSADGDEDYKVGIEIYGGGALLLDCNVRTNSTGDRTALAVGAWTRVMGGSYELGFLPGDGETAVDISADAELYDVTVVASGTGSSVKLEAHDDISVTMSRVNLKGRVRAWAAAGHSAGLVLEHSRVDALGSTLRADAGVAIVVGATQLAGDPVDPNGGFVVCAGVWDESWLFYPNTCP